MRRPGALATGDEQGEPRGGSMDKVWRRQRTLHVGSEIFSPYELNRGMCCNYHVLDEGNMSLAKKKLALAGVDQLMSF
jgi:hypothetical protein